MKRFCKLVAIMLALTLLPVLVLVRYLEASNKFDALGWWYSLLVTVVVSIPLAAFLVSIMVFVANKKQR